MENLTVAEPTQAALDKITDSAIKSGVHHQLSQIDRSNWTRDDYASRIHSQLTSSLVVVCTLLKELKDKFFAEDDNRSQSWVVFCREKIGMSYPSVSAYLRIGRYVLPRIENRVAEKLGKNRMLELAKLKDHTNWDEIVDEIKEDMSFKQVQDVVKKHMPEPDSKPKKRKTGRQIARRLADVYDDLVEWLPALNDSDDHALDKWKGICNEIWNQALPLREFIDKEIKQHVNE